MAMVIITAMLIILAVVKWLMPLSNAIVAASRGQAYEDLLAKLFQRAGWSVQRQAKDLDEGIDLVAQHGNQKYIVQIKASSEARRDRAVPLLSQAILEAQAAAQRIPGPAIPVAVLAVDHVSKSLAEHVQAFVERNAPNMAVGLIDASGFRMFRGPRYGMAQLRRFTFARRARAGETVLSCLFVF